MTISSTVVRQLTAGDGSTTNFTYPFKIFADSDLSVIIRSSTGTETPKTITTHYTVAGAGDASGGSITFTSGNVPTATETVVMIREVPQTQAIDYIANDPFPAESHEEGLDRAAMTTQQMQEELDRSFKVSATNSITTPEFTDDAASRASKALGFDSTGNVLTTVADFLPSGGDSAMFQYSTTTADADPGAGFFRLNNATIASATIAYFDDLEYNGTDISAWVQSWDDVTGNDTNRGRIRITKAQSLDTWMVFKVTGAVTDATGYTKVSLVYIDSAGTFTLNDKCWVAFSASGEDGAIPGYYYKFDTGTSDADPGAGEIAFNHATYASATRIYIDDADANGVTTQADTETWGASTSTIKGSLHIVDINDSTTYARFKITAAVTDASGYNTITVVHLASNNTFSAADELSVTFIRAGDKGTTGSTGSTGATGATGDVSLAGTETLTNKTLTSPKINEDVVLASTSTELNKLDALSRGSIIYGNASAATAVLTKGSANQILISDGTDIAWGANTVADNAITLAKMAPGTDGNLITYDASGNPAAVATGTSGHFLKSQGAGSVPVFAAAAGGGKVGQVVTTQLTDVTSTTSTSMVAISGYTRAITPVATSSKVLVTMYLTIGGNSNQVVPFQMFRNTTQIALGDADSSRARVTFAWRNPGADFNYTPIPFCVSWLDNPASTSEQTYSMKWSTTADTVYLNRSWDNTDAIDYGRSVSCVILQEILA
jgi:hypothetical protein